MEMMRLQPRELLLGATFLLAMIAFFYRHNAIRDYRSIQTETTTSLAEIQEVSNLKRLWNSKGVRTKLNQLKGVIPASSFTLFTIDQHKTHLRAEKLDGPHLNRLISRIGSLPVEILSLKVDRRGEQYTMECRCKW
jgi:hypothetical protein